MLPYTFQFSETNNKHPIQYPLHHPASTMDPSPALTMNTNSDSSDATGVPPPVLLTPRPMTDEELAMPTTTAAPTTKGASEVSSLEPSDSGTAPPSSKKARTTSLSTAMKQSHLKSSSNNDIAEVVDADVEGATANEEIKWSLVRPESSGRKFFSKVWSHFKVFNYVIHPDKKSCVACILCFEEKNYDCGTICAKSGNTSGLMHHVKI